MAQSVVTSAKRDPNSVRVALCVNLVVDVVGCYFGHDPAVVGVWVVEVCGDGEDWSNLLSWQQCGNWFHYVYPVGAVALRWSCDVVDGVDVCCGDV